MQLYLYMSEIKKCNGDENSLFPTKDGKSDEKSGFCLEFKKKV